MFQKFVTQALKVAHPSKWVIISPDALEDLAWWSIPQNLEKGVLCVPLKLDPQITTDASDSIWGAQIEGALLQEKWSTEDYQTHINHKELFAVLSTLERWGKIVRGGTVLDEQPHSRLKTRGTRLLSMTKQRIICIY